MKYQTSYLPWLVILITGLGVEAVTPGLELSSIVAEGAKFFIERLQIQNSLEHVFGESDHDHSVPETRGGWGHGGGGHGHGAITLDPVSIISLLALGAFLINNILQLLRANMNGGVNVGRSMDGIPIALPPISFAGIDQSGDREPSFADFFGNIGSLYYLQPKKRHMCMKRVVCNYIHMKESREASHTNPLKTKLFDFMLTTVAKIVSPELDNEGKDDRCLKAQKFCSDALLKDARISAEFKVYSQVSTWLTKLAFNGLATG